MVEGGIQVVLWREGRRTEGGQKGREMDRRQHEKTLKVEWLE